MTIASLQQYLLQHPSLIFSTITLGISVFVAFFVFYHTPKRDRFKEAVKITPQRLEIFRQKGAKWDALSRDDQLKLELDATVNDEFEQIKSRHWGPKYQWAIETLLKKLDSVLGKRRVANTEQAEQAPSLYSMFSAQSFEFCLLVALLYPFLFTLIGWLFSDTVNIGRFEFLPHISIWEKVAFFTALIGMIYSAGKVNSKTGKERIVWLLLLFLSIVAVAFAVAVAGAVAVAFAVAVAVAVVVAVAVAVAVAGTVAFAVAVAVAVAGAGAVAVAVAVAGALYLFSQLEKQKSSNPRRYWINFYLLAISLLLLSMGALLYFGRAKDLPIISVPLFLGLFPLFNALVDWASLAVTRYLLYKVHLSHKQWTSVLGFALLDVFLALLFVGLITTVLVVVIGLFNLAGAAIVDQSVLNFTPIMRDLLNPEKAGEMFWVHGMVLSTIVPTVIHLLFALYAVALWPKIGWPEKAINDFWDSPANRVALVRMEAWSAGFAVILFAAICYLLYLGFDAIETVLYWLWQWANWLLIEIDPTYIPYTPRPIE